MGFKTAFLCPKKGLKNRHLEQQQQQKEQNCFSRESKISLSCFSISVFFISRLLRNTQLPFSSFRVSSFYPPPCVPIKPPLCAQECKSPSGKKLRGREQRHFLLFYSNAAFWECRGEYRTGGIYLRLKKFSIAVVDSLGSKNRSELLFAETCMLLGKWNLFLEMCISSSLHWQFEGPSSGCQLGPRKPRVRSSCKPHSWCKSHGKHFFYTYLVNVSQQILYDFKSQVNWERDYI